jgi:hypothetical protein
MLGVIYLYDWVREKRQLAEFAQPTRCDRQGVGVLASGWGISQFIGFLPTPIGAVRIPQICAFRTRTRCISPAATATHAWRLVMPQRRHRLRFDAVEDGLQHADARR